MAEEETVEWQRYRHSILSGSMVKDGPREAVGEALKPILRPI